MQVDSYLEIFTTFYGWAFANIIGELITGTGLLIIPFAVIIFNGWRAAKEQGMQSGGVLGVIESVQTKLIVALFVFSMCFATTPIASLTNAHLEFTPNETILNPTPETGNATSGAGSFNEDMADAVDGSMSDAGGLSHVPLWWYAVMSVGSGVNNAIRKGLANQGQELRTVEDLARTATIDDPNLLYNISRFYSECYVKASSRYQRMDKSELSASDRDIIDSSNKRYGPEDVSWIGSHLFRSNPQFYASIYAAEPVAEFPVDYDRDGMWNPSSGTEPPHPGVVNATSGRPSCKDWWENPSYGLREQMISHSSKFEQIGQTITNWRGWIDGEERRDTLAKLAQYKANPAFIDESAFVSDDYDIATGIGRSVTTFLSTFGVAKQAWLASLKVGPLLTGVYMLQAVILMGIYAFLPLMIFFSGYSLRAMFLGAVAVFTVKMWASMWFIATWVDAHLINAMYPGANGNAFINELSHMFNSGGAAPQFYKRMILNIILLALIVGLPLIWTAMMSWIGVRLGGEFANVVGGTGGMAASAAQSSHGATTAGAKLASGAGKFLK